MSADGITLYHNEISTCAQKVRLALAEKHLEFDSVLLDLIAGEQHQPDYLKMNPGGVVPTLVNGDDVVIESNVINEYIADTFEGAPLRPAAPAARAKMRLWTKRLDEAIHPHTVTLSFGIAFRHRLLNQPEEDREAFLSGSPSPERRAHMRDLVDNGTASAKFPQAIQAFGNLVGDMQKALESSAWLAGSEFSLADIAYTPYATRLEHLALEKLWDDKPEFADWFARVKARPSYHKAIGQWIPDAVIESMRGIGQREWPAVEAALG